MPIFGVYCPHARMPINTVTSANVVLELIYRLKIKDVMSTALITATRDDDARDPTDHAPERITGLPIVMANASSAW